VFVPGKTFQLMFVVLCNSVTQLKYWTQSEGRLLTSPENIRLRFEV